MNCPHCDRDLPTPPDSLRWQEFWQCGCGGLYGVKATEPVAYPIPPLDTLRMLETVSLDRAKRWAFYENRPYVYALCGPAGVPFYVGKGIKQRLAEHEREADTLPDGAQTEKHAVIHQFRRHGFDARYSILEFCDSATDAESLEAILIARYGRRCDRTGCLTNTAAPTAIDTQRTESRPEPPPEKPTRHWHPLPVEHPDNFDDGASPLGERTEILIHCPTCNRKLSYLARVARRRCRCPECSIDLVPSEVRQGERIQLID